MARVRKQPIQRFLLFVAFQRNGCWIWTGCTNGTYPRFGPGGRVPMIRAHRWSYEFFQKKIEKGKELHHLCKNKLCVSPYHLKEVTHRDHMLLDDTIPGRNAKKTHCVNGHSLADCIRKDNGNRNCRQCNNEARRKYYKNHKEASREYYKKHRAEIQAYRKACRRDQRLARTA